MTDIIGKIPEFTTDETTVSPETEVKEVETTTVPPETDTPAPPAEKPLPEVGEENPEPPVQDELAGAIKGLQEERAKLLKEVIELKGQKRQIKQDQIKVVQDRLDELKDLHPQDVETIERVLRAKGLMTRKEADQMFYEAVKEEELNKFLEKYPEYKPENDPGDANWNAIQREIGYYKMPESPRQIGEILERAHRGVVRVTPNLESLATRKRQVQIASVGQGGAQKQVSSPKFDSDRRSMLRQGGFSEEDIQSMERRASS